MKKKIIATLLMLLPLTSFGSDLYKAHLSSYINIDIDNIKPDGSPVSESARYLALRQCVDGDYTWSVNENYDTATHFDNVLKTDKDKNIYEFTISYNDIDCDNLTLHNHTLSKKVVLDKNSGYIGIYQVGKETFTVTLEKQ